jgi:hypothetical protein
MELNYSERMGFGVLTNSKKIQNQRVGGQRLDVVNEEGFSLN